ncbi:MAG: hypothetical protein U5S82_07000 [Gammaproteobacteria bacterium]|nr:hypothetical protein [Gammaproteobacteria bacterium]
MPANKLALDPTGGSDFSSLLTGRYAYELIRARDTTSLDNQATLSVASQPGWLQEITERLNELINLPENWDSYGAKPVYVECAIHTLRLLSEISKPQTPIPTVIPTSEGNLQVEWHLNGIDLEVKVLAIDRLEVFFEDEASQGPEWEGELSYDLSPLSHFIECISRR